MPSNYVTLEKDLQNCINSLKRKLPNNIKSNAYFLITISAFILLNERLFSYCSEIYNSDLTGLRESYDTQKRKISFFDKMYSHCQHSKASKFCSTDVLRGLLAEIPTLPKKEAICNDAIIGVCKAQNKASWLIQQIRYLENDPSVYNPSTIEIYVMYVLAATCLTALLILITVWGKKLYAQTKPILLGNNETRLISKLNDVLEFRVTKEDKITYAIQKLEYELTKVQKIMRGGYFILAHYKNSTNADGKPNIALHSVFNNRDIKRIIMKEVGLKPIHG